MLQHMKDVHQRECHRLSCLQDCNHTRHKVFLIYHAKENRKPIPDYHSNCSLHRSIDQCCDPCPNIRPHQTEQNLFCHFSCIFFQELISLTIRHNQEQNRVGNHQSVCLRSSILQVSSSQCKHKDCGDRDQAFHQTPYYPIFQKKKDENISSSSQTCHSSEETLSILIYYR